MPFSSPGKNYPFMFWSNVKSLFGKFSLWENDKNMKWHTLKIAIKQVLPASAIVNNSGLRNAILGNLRPTEIRNCIQADFLRGGKFCFSVDKKANNFSYDVNYSTIELWAFYGHHFHKTQQMLNPSLSLPVVIYWQKNMQ